MKKTVIIMIGLLLISGVVYAESLSMEKATGDITARISLGSNPPVVGNNSLHVELLDEKGQHVTDAAVEVYYFMPSMPAMNYTSKTDLVENSYVASIKPVMAGKWQVNVKFVRADGKLHEVSFDFDAKQ
jgi:nitrogen fixation protein FixH